MIRILYLVPMNQLLLFTGGGDKKSNYTRPPGEVGQADRPAVRYATKSARSRGGDMPGKNLRVRSSEGGEFDCYLAAPPDLFWRTVPGPLSRDDERTKQRSQPRLEKIRTGEADLADTLAFLRKQPQSNGRAALIGFCYGGPYAILGPKRLGYDAGISCHGSQMLDFIGELEGLAQPVCIIWGDDDHQAA